MNDETRSNVLELARRVTLYRRLSVGLGLLALFLVLVVVAQLTASPTLGGDSAPRPTESSARELASRDPDDPMAMGDVDAPVVLVQWTDMRCPFCAAVHRDTLPTVVQEYVDEGLVRLEVRDVSFFGEQSEDAAVAARAAAEQGKFFEYLDAVYGAAPPTGHPDMPRDALIAFAEQAGVPDIAQFTADLDDPGIRAAARSSTSDAQALGVNAVPFFVAGDVALSGAQPISVFREYLDQALESAG